MVNSKAGGVQPETVRELCLSMPEAVEKPHFDRTSFRVNKRIFVTLGPEDDRCVVKLSVADREALLASHPDVFLDVGWASQGWLGIRLSVMEPAMLKQLITTAWCNVAPKKLANNMAKNLSE